MESLSGSNEQRNVHQSNPYLEGRSTSSFFVFVAVVAVLYFAREVLIPVALAILISSALAPLVRRLERVGLNRVIAVSTACLIAFGAIGMVSWFSIEKMVELAPKLSEYQANIFNKVTTLKKEVSGVLLSVTKAAKGFESNLIEPVTTTRAVHPGPSETDKVIPVQIVANPFDPLSLVQATLSSLVSPLATIGIVIVFTIFILINREDLRNRFIRLIAHGQLSRTTQAIDEATSGVSHYLLMQLLLNVSHGVILTIGLYFIGVPNALVWGVLSAVLRFIPYLGPWLAALAPILLSFAVSDGWAQPLLTISFFIVLELISNNVMEPWLYGSSTGLSPVAIIVSAVFWTWLWGGVGLLMSTPLTVCLLVVGRYVHRGEFLYILLGDQPMLSLSERFYQRLLSRDGEEAIEIVEGFLKTDSLEALYDTVLSPALISCEEDRQRRLLDATSYSYIIESTKDLVEELIERDRNDPSIGKPGQTNDLAESGDLVRRFVLCVASGDERDEIAGRMFTHSLDRMPVSSEVLSPDLLNSEILDKVAQTNPAVVCLSALPPFALTRVRTLARKINARFPNVKIIVCLWHTQFDPAKTKSHLEGVGVSCVVTTISEARQAVEKLVL